MKYLRLTPVGHGCRSCRMQNYGFPALSTSSIDACALVLCRVSSSGSIPSRMDSPEPNLTTRMIEQIRLLMDTYPWWVVALVSALLTVLIRFVVVRLFKLAFTLLLFALIYCAVLLGLSFLLT